MKIEEIIEMEKKRYFENCKKFYLAKYQIEKLEETSISYKTCGGSPEESEKLKNFYKGAAGECLLILNRLEVPENETNRINATARLISFTQIWDGDRNED